MTCKSQTFFGTLSTDSRKRNNSARHAPGEPMISPRFLVLAVFAAAVLGSVFTLAANQLTQPSPADAAAQAAAAAAKAVAVKDAAVYSQLRALNRTTKTQAADLDAIRMSNQSIESGINGPITLRAQLSSIVDAVRPMQTSLQMLQTLPNQIGGSNANSVADRIYHLCVAMSDPSRCGPQ